MQIECWKITGGPFHFGRHGLGQEETLACLPSDSLFSGLLASIANLEGDQALDEWIRPYLAGQAPVVLSSTFPFAGDVRFYPLPAGARAGEGGHQPVRFKDLKAIAFVSESLFKRLAAGETLLDLLPAAFRLQGKSVLVSREEIAFLPAHLQQEGAQIWQIERRPRVTIDRVTAASAIYFTGLVTYNEGCGLWFGARWLETNPDLMKTFAASLAELADAGLGGERSAGMGKSHIETWGPVHLPDPDSGPWITLSRYLPNLDEMAGLADPLAAYKLIRIGGWLHSSQSSGQRRRPVNMLVEGSVFGPVSRTVPGQVIEVGPRYPADLNPLDHKVYRCGQALAVGLSGGHR